MVIYSERRRFIDIHLVRAPARINLIYDGVRRLRLQLDSVPVALIKDLRLLVRFESTIVRAKMRMQNEINYLLF